MILWKKSKRSLEIRRSKTSDVTAAKAGAPNTAELYGLDLPEMGIDGYSGIKLDKNSETPL